MNHRIGIWIIVIAVLFGGIWYWQSSKVNSISTSQEPIKIGGLISLTGVAATFGEMSKMGIDLAVEEINAKGGIKGRMVQVIIEDDQTDPKVAVGLYHKFTGIDNVDGIIGSNFDFVTQAVFPLAKNGDTVLLVPSSPRIPGAFDTNEKSFIMMTDFEKILEAFRDYLQTEKYTKFAIVRFESVFGQEITRVLKPIVEVAGKGEVIDESYKNIGQADFKTTILKLKQAKVDLVFMDMISADHLTFLRQAQDLNFHPKLITHNGINDALTMKDINKNLLENIIVLDWNVTTDEFTKRFKARYGQEPTKSANRAYDAVYVLAEAVSKVSSKAEIATYIEKNSFTTPNGIVKFNNNHAAENTAVGLFVIKSGKFVEYKK
ncbi:ABC transporter substrate-binding protein [Candidatus Kaiserbacteria bacterium]|nr:ABC transporter substrate-binding protein [Candidatus Kaiserbacteria bacterium]